MFLTAVILMLAIGPLFASSLFWTMHPEATSWMRLIPLPSCDFLQVICVLAYAFSRTNDVAVVKRIADGAGFLFVIAVLPLVVHCAVNFWVVRPDTWEVLIWRLKDDWNQWQFHYVLRKSVCLLLTTLVLWLFSHWRQITLLPNHEMASPPKSRITIMQLMTLTTMTACIAGVLLHSEWSPSVDDIIGLVKAIPLTLSAIATAYWMTRRQRNGWLIVLLLAIVSYCAINFGESYYYARTQGRTLLPTELIFHGAIYSGLLTVECLAAWWLLAWRGNKLLRRDVTQSIQND